MNNQHWKYFVSTQPLEASQVKYKKKNFTKNLIAKIENVIYLLK